MSTRLHIVVSDELLARIDAFRADSGCEDVPRSVWLRRAIEAYLGDRSIPTSRAEQAASCTRCDGYPEGVRCPECGEPTPAPTERLVDDAQALAEHGLEATEVAPGLTFVGARRSSSQAKRGTGPRPKKGK